MSAPFVSVIVPVFNREAAVREAVSSLARQTLQDIEIIVVDDGSGDASAEAAERAGGSLVQVIRHSENRGIPAARNTGLRAARGKYVAWLDSDDLARPKRLERQVRFLEGNPQIALVGCCAGRMGQGGEHTGMMQIPPFRHEPLAAALLFRSPFQQSSIMGTAAALKGFEYRPEFPVCEDLDMFIRISRKHRIANLREVLIDRRMHPGQINRADSALVRDHKRVLFRKLLHEVGVDASDEDLDRHITLGSPRKQPQPLPFILWAEQWMKQLRAANRRTGRFDQRALALVCARAWINGCRLAMHGDQRLPVARALFASSLTLGIANPSGLDWLTDVLPLMLGVA